MPFLGIPFNTWRMGPVSVDVFEELIAETHKEGSLWRETAIEHGLLEDFEQKKASTSNVVIDMARGLSKADRDFYEDTLNIRESANLMRLDRELGRV